MTLSWCQNLRLHPDQKIKLEIMELMGRKIFKLKIQKFLNNKTREEFYLTQIQIPELAVLTIECRLLI